MSFCRAMLYKRGHMLHVMRYPSVRPSVCLPSSYILSKGVNISSKFFHHWVSPHHSSFSTPKDMAIFRRGPRNGGVECRWGRRKSRLSANIWLSDRLLLHCDQQLMDQQLTVVGAVVYSSYGARLFTAQTAKHQWLCRREENRLIVCSDKSEAEVTIENCARRVVLLKQTTDRHEASRDLSATAGLLVSSVRPMWRHNVANGDVLSKAYSVCIMADT